MTETKGLVSVIIPFHNRERFLGEAIENVLGQTYAHWELILVDDGATDRSTEIARSYARHSSGRIAYLEHPGHQNSGVTRTRNLGAENSRGEYLAFLDSDDVWFPEKLEKYVSLMERHPTAGCVYGPSEYWYDWDPEAAPVQQNAIEPLAPGELLYSPPALLSMTHPFGRRGAPCPSSLLLRHGVFERVGGFVEAFNPHTYQLYEDTAFLTKLYLQAPVYVTTLCSDRYRCHAQSIWYATNGYLREEAERRFYFQWLREYLTEHPIAEREILKTIRRRAWPYWMPLPNTVTRLLRHAASRLSR
jgi:glycosyltransferase involved in cell wall biosynthesis